MKRFDGNVSPFQSALQETPEVLKPVGVNLAVYVPFCMVDYPVVVLSEKPVVRLQSVRVERRSRFDVGFYLSMNALLFAIVEDCCLDLSAPFQGSEDDGLVLPASPGNASFPLVEMHIAGLPADEGFVDFHFPAELAGVVVLQNQSKPLKHEPCGLLSDFQIAGDFVTAYPVFAVDKHPESGKPLVEADGGILEDRSDLHGEFALRMMSRTCPGAALGIEGAYPVGPTCRANHPSVRPSVICKILDAIVRIGEIYDCFLKAFGSVFHLVLHHDKVYHKWMVESSTLLPQYRAVFRNLPTTKIEHLYVGSNKFVNLMSGLYDGNKNLTNLESPNQEAHYVPY
jgi:hypothetical protein